MVGQEERGGGREETASTVSRATPGPEGSVRLDRYHRANKMTRSRRVVRKAEVADLTELELPDTMKTSFPDPTDVLNFLLTITPDEGESAR